MGVGRLSPKAEVSEGSKVVLRFIWMFVVKYGFFMGSYGAATRCSGSIGCTGSTRIKGCANMAAVSNGLSHSPVNGVMNSLSLDLLQVVGLP